MINRLIDSIAAALNNEFGDGFEVYTEDIEQGLTEPCFLVTCVSPKSKLFRDLRYYRENLFMIQYFPKGSDCRSEGMAVQERLYQALEYIQAGGLKRGTEMQGEMVDGVLQFQVQYNFFMQKEETGGDLMESLSSEIDTR